MRAIVQVTRLRSRASSYQRWSILTIIRIRIGDVIFGDSALNAEEGKYTVNKAGKTVFLPDYHPVDVRIGDMQAFADDGNRLGTHYGDFITVSAFRGDGPQIFNRINTQVRKVLVVCLGDV